MGREDYIQSFSIIGRGANAGPDGTIVVDGGWDTEASLEGAVVVQLKKQLKSAGIRAEFRAYTETRFEGSMHKLATKKDDPKNIRIGKVFQQLVEVVYDSKHPLNPSANGTAVSLPFSFRLPRKNLPPSFETVSASIQYYIKTSVLYQDGMKLLRSTFELEVPVIVRMPQIAIYNMISSPSPFSHDSQGTADKVGFSLHIPQRIVTIGDSVELHVTINSTPQDARLRMLNCQLRNVVSCLNSEGFAVQQKFPRPLSEVSQPFNLVSVTPGYSDPIVRRLYFTVDPQIALQSLESPLVSSRSILRVQIVLDTSETPNVSMEIPIVVVPRNTEGYEPPGVASSGTSQYSVMATPILRATTIQSPQLNPNNENGSSGGSFLDILASPPQSPQRMTSQGGMSARFGPTAPTASSTVTSSPTTKLTSEKSPSSLPSPGSEIPATNTFARMTLGAQSPVLSDSRYAQPVSANSRSNLTPSNLVYEAPTLNRSTPVPQTNVYTSSSNGRGIAAPNNVVYDIPTLIPPRTPTLNRSTPVPPSPVGMNLHVPPSPSARATPTNMMQIPQQPVYQIPQEAQGTQLNMTWDEKRAPILQQQQQLLEQQRHLQQQQQLLEQQLRLQQQQHALEQQLLLQQQQHQLEQEQQHYQPSWEEKRSQPVVSQRREWQEPIAAPAYTASPPTISSVDKESLSSGFRSMVAEWDVEKVADWAKTLGATADSIQKFIDNAIDGQVLLTLTDEDLKGELAVTALGVRRKMVVAIREMSQN
ncbi:hypothetical protein BCR33DRAFT_58709 [Rhizoclosmatium globosum]|uniref:SAM domain-containing protein n=1 Tax=Rhizoclosmatium globosum TaxID=329046 RepID=A0A1Y2CM57_9FUNG|nr:hypothetical protein BCR33DRAFT_58709 [Rhizoclosmatium globosum]|eukprot:ORY48111.1 hypothetical protein BCR33DRAFT_58709 [Rhizoclosmatium globosum]